ncbi:MAG: NUDIX hydrolase [Candidatus Bathyarchaeia archaeon]|jgi:ADP-ribose pyrophosphatase YjhB (NUDIX family)
MRRLYLKQPLVGVGAVVVCSGKILLEKRKNEPGKGKWSIPGGLVELGENMEQTVIREVKEETGLDVEKPEQIDVVDSITEDENGRIRYHFVIIDYFVKLKGGALKASSDAEELTWVQFDLVEAYDLTNSFRAFFQRNRQRIEAFSSCP